MRKRRARYTTCLGGALLVLLLAAGPARAAGRCGVHPWCNTALSPDRRAELLLADLSRDERISLLGGDDITGVSGGPNSHTGTSDGIPRVDLPPVYFSDGPVGPRQGPATAMPVPLALAATFDPRLAFQHGGVVANEARSKGNDVVFAPTVNIMRTPLGGRTFEAYGEDPFLVSRLTVGWIRGAQAQGVIADVKHYAANNQEGYAGPAANQSNPGQFLGPPPTEGGRMMVNEIIDERTLREIYLPQFEAAVKEAHVGTIMCAYNQVNDHFACENRHLLTDVLRRDWAFQGFVLADYGAAHNTPDNLNNGLDFDPWPGIALSPTLVNASLSSGSVSQATIDQHVKRILRTLFAYGFFDRAAYRNDDAQIDKAGHAGTAQRIESSAITLLENRGALPLDASRLRSIAVIGKQADTFVTGGGSGAVTPFSFTSARQAIAQRAGPGVAVRYDDGSDADQAAADAAASDVAIVFAGDYETEGSDRYCLSLECPDQGDQDGLIERVAAANPNTIVVLESGVVLTPWRDRVRALVEAWYPGQQGGPAIASMLFGDSDPAGRLPVTFPRQEADLPTAGDPEKYPGVGDRAQYKEGVLVGYRWYDAKGLQPAYPFGFGLSYTTFSFRRLRVRPAASGRLGATVSIDVVNTGTRRGTAVPQLYLGIPQPSPGVVEPPRQLRGLAKVSLAPGARRRVTFRIDSRSLSYWNVRANDWRVAPGCYGVLVARSSRDVARHATLAVNGAPCAGAAARIPAPRAARRCTRRRRYSIDLHGVRASQVRRVTVYVNGRRRSVLRGPRDTVPVDLRRARAGRVRVRLVVRTRTGPRVVTHTYRLCATRSRGRRR